MLSYALKEDNRICELCRDWIDENICRIIVNNSRLYLHKKCYKKYLEYI